MKSHDKITISSKMYSAGAYSTVLCLFIFEVVFIFQIFFSWGHLDFWGCPPSHFCGQPQFLWVFIILLGRLNFRGHLHYEVLFIFGVNFIHILILIRSFQLQTSFNSNTRKSDYSNTKLGTKPGYLKVTKHQCVPKLSLSDGQLLL